MSETTTIQRSTTTPCCRTTSHRTRHFQTLWVRLLLIGGAHALRGTLVQDHQWDETHYGVLYSEENNGSKYLLPYLLSTTVVDCSVS
jgi:hypothetical protein